MPKSKGSGQGALLQMGAGHHDCFLDYGTPKGTNCPRTAKQTYMRAARLPPSTGASFGWYTVRISHTLLLPELGSYELPTLGSERVQKIPWLHEAKTGIRAQKKLGYSTEANRIKLSLPASSQHRYHPTDPELHPLCEYRLSLGSLSLMEIHRPSWPFCLRSSPWWPTKSMHIVHSFILEQWASHWEGSF